MEETAQQVIEHMGTGAQSPPYSPRTFMQDRWAAAGFIIILFVILIYVIDRVLQKLKSR